MWTIPRPSGYVAFVGLLSLASAACLFGLAARYDVDDARYQLSLRASLFLTMPSLIYAAFWIWWKNRYLRVIGGCMGLLLLMFCAHYLQAGPVGGDMDFGAPFVAMVLAAGCFVLSVVAFAVVGLVAFVWPRVLNKPAEP